MGYKNKMHHFTLGLNDEDYNKFEFVVRELTGKKGLKPKKTIGFRLMVNEYYKLIGEKNEICKD